MLRKSKLVMLLMVIIFSLGFICFASGTESVDADSAVSGNYLLSDNIHTFPIGDGRFYILSSDSKNNSSLISCFDVNSKAFVSRCEVPYLYDSCACDGENLYLATNDYIKRIITINKYYTYTNSRNEVNFDSEVIELNDKNLSNKSSFEVDNHGTVFILDVYDNSKICAKPWRGSMTYVGHDKGPFESIKMNFSKDVLYATTLSGGIISFNTTEDYAVKEFFASQEVPSDYNFINDNLLVNAYGGVYEVDTEADTINFLFNIESDDAGKFTCIFSNKILTVSAEGELNLINYSNNITARLSLNGDLIGLSANADSIIALTNFDGTKYIRIVKFEDFDINSSTDEGDGEDTGNEGSESEDSDDNKDDETSGGAVDNSSEIGITSSIHEFNMSDHTITNVDLGTTIAMFKSNISCPNYTLAFKNYSGKEMKSGKLGTGAKVTFSKGESEVHEFIFVVAGDLTGEGNCNSRDLSLLLNHLLGKENLEGVFLKAADLNNDGEVNAADLLLLERKINY